MGRDTQPVVSFIVPARNEAAYLASTLEHIQNQTTTREFDCLVVDGQSDDETPEIARKHGARVLDGTTTGQGNDRHLGAVSAKGQWLAFVDADTRVAPSYLEAMLSFVQRERLEGATSRCRVTGGWRTVPFEWLFNYVLPRLSPPPFPGFNVFVHRDAYVGVGGFSSGPNEDMTFSRRLGQQYRTSVCPEVVVETSGRRIEQEGLFRTLSYYTKLEYQRQRRLRLG